MIVNISSFGGVRYIFNCAYGIGKAACDRMAVDCGIELKKSNVTMLSLYPGAVKTELVTHLTSDSTVGNMETKKVNLSLKKRILLQDNITIFYLGTSNEASV